MIVSDETRRSERLLELKDILMTLKYPVELIDNAILRCQSSESSAKKPEMEKIAFSLTIYRAVAQQWTRWLKY